jgi:mannosyltransferase
VTEYASQTHRTKGPRHLSLRLWLGVVVAIATALRLFRLGTKSFWLDEATSVVLARVDRQVFVAALIHRQANMALYYVLLRGWIRVGSSEFVIRCLSVLAGVAAIPAIYLLGARLFGPRAGRLAALLLSVHAFHIRYSQEARSYSLFMLLAILSSLFLLRSLEQPSRKNRGGYILVSTLMVYAQVFGGWMLLAQWLSVYLLSHKVRWKEFLVSAATICLLISPLAGCLLFASDRSQLHWLTRPTLHDLCKFSLDITGDGGPLLLLVYVALVLGGVGIAVGQMNSHSSEGAWKYRFLLIWLILPVAFVLAISFRWPAFEPRFLIFCLPPLVLLAADALARVRSKLLLAAALTILLGLSLNGTYSYHRGRADAEHTDNWRDATRYILLQAQPDDAVVFSYSEERLAFDEYQRQLQMTGSRIHEFPEETDLELLTLRPSRPDAELLNNIVGSYERVWVISAFQPNPASRRAEAPLAASFREYSERSFGFVHADLYANKIPPTARERASPK